MSESLEVANVGTLVSTTRIDSFSRYALIIMIILITADISIMLDVPIYRQVMGILLLLLPGLIFTRLLNLTIKNMIEKILVILGICVSIILLSGLFFNYILLNIGINTPLSTESQLIILNFLSILFLFFESRKPFCGIKINIPKIRLNKYDKFFLSVVFLIPACGIYGIYIMNIYNNNILLLSLFIFVSIVIILISLYDKKIASGICPVLIFSISITFVLLYPLRSDHLLGMDAHTEYYVFQQVPAFALIFFALFIMVLFNNTLLPVQKSTLLLLFSMSMILSHYSSTFVFLFIILFYFIISSLLAKKINFKRELNGALVLAIVIIIFLWYSMISGSIFNISVSFVNSVLDVDNMNVAGAHSEMLSQLGGSNISPNYVSWMNLITTWLFLLLIGLGVLGLVLHSIYNMFESMDIEREATLKKEFEPNFVIIALICVIILVMTVILPFLSTAYGFDRVYLQTSIILSVLFIYGCKYATTIINKIDDIFKSITIGKKRNNHFDIDKMGNFIIIVVLIPHLLFMANIPHQLTGIGDSIIFNSAGSTYDYYYIHDSDISCITWLDSSQIQGHNLWADHFGAFQIRNQQHVKDSLEIYSWEIPKGDYIYLRETNIAKNLVYYNYGIAGTINDISSNEYQLDKIYSSPAVILFRS